MALQRAHWFGVKACEVGLPQLVQRRTGLRLGVIWAGGFRPGVTGRVAFFGSLEDIISGASVVDRGK